jgi:hypothetical protein
MISKILNLKRFVRKILPSTYFVVLFALGAFGSKLLSVNLIAGFILLLLLLNIFLHNNIIGRVFGIIFLLGSFYMTLALFDDIADGEATLRGGYWVGLVLIIISLIMSVLLIWGYEKQKQLCETENIKT